MILYSLFIVCGDLLCRRTRTCWREEGKWRQQSCFERMPTENVNKLKENLLIWTQLKKWNEQTRHINGLQISICLSYTKLKLRCSFLFVSFTYLSLENGIRLRVNQKKEKKKMVDMFFYCVKAVKETHKWTGVLVLGVLVANTWCATERTRTHDATNNDCVSFSDQFQFVVDVLLSD